MKRWLRNSTHWDIPTPLHETFQLNVFDQLQFVKKILDEADLLQILAQSKQHATRLFPNSQMTYVKALGPVPAANVSGLSQSKELRSL